MMFPGSPIHQRRICLGSRSRGSKQVPDQILRHNGRECCATRDDRLYVNSIMERGFKTPLHNTLFIKRRIHIVDILLTQLLLGEPQAFAEFSNLSKCPVAL